VKPSGFDHKSYLAALPKRPGVYRMFGAEQELLYVGKARSLRDRVGTYFAASNVDPKVQALVQQISAIEVTVTNSETEALLLEYNLIKAHKPRFNIVLRDDKSFPYIQLCDEHRFPRLAFYRGPRHPGSAAEAVPHPQLPRQLLRQPQPSVPAAPDRALLGPLRRPDHARGLRPGHSRGDQGARGPQ
jgi:excinuclease ABC subunit C